MEEKQISAKGPIGLLIEMVILCGARINDQFRIIQANEEDIDFMNTPFQDLGPLVEEVAQRGRMRADRRTKVTKMA